VDWVATYRTDGDKMRVAITLARLNVETGSGGPFGAAVFERRTGRLVACGVNLVLPLKNSVLHAEVVALMFAQSTLGTHDLGPSRDGPYELFTSCEPCAMCIGAVHWSGVSRLVTGATRDDVENIGFDEGPVQPASYQYLEDHGIAIVHQVLRDDARSVLTRYINTRGSLY
jgi:tRNA(Arg) A34 adenosine deaminase TadA